MEVQTALLQQLREGSPPPPLVDSPTGTMEDQMEREDEVVPSPSVYSVKSAPARKNISTSSNQLFRQSPKSDCKKSVYSDGYRRNRRKNTGKAYVALADPDGTKKKAIVNSSPELEAVTKMQHLSTRSVCSDGVRNRRQPQKNDSSCGSVAMSLPGRFSSPFGKSEALLRVRNAPSSSSSSSDDEEEESFYSAGGSPATSPLDTRADVERLVHCIMPEEDQNVEQMLERFQGRETVLLQTLCTLYEQQTAISRAPKKKKKKRIGETRNDSTPSGLVARDKLGRITRTASGSNLKPRSLGSLLRLHSDTGPQSSSLSQKENDGGAPFFFAEQVNSLKSRNTSSASFATPRSKQSASINTPAHSKGTMSKSYNSMGAESLVVNPGSIGSVLRRYWDSTLGLLEPTTEKKKTSAAASHRTDPGHRLDGNKESILVGSKSVSGNPYREATKQERHLAIEFALETGDWEKVAQVGAGVSDNSVSTISTDSELLLGMDEQVELQFVDALEEDEVVRRGSPSTLSINAREVLAQRIEDCANQLDAVIEEDDWSAVMEIINKYTGRDKNQTPDSQDEVASGQDVTNEVTLNGSSCASSPYNGAQENSSTRAVGASIESEARETSLMEEEAAGQEVETTASDTLYLSVQRADDQGGCERSEVIANGGNNHSRRGTKSSHKHSSKDKLKVNKDTKKKKTIEESVEIYMKEAQQQEDEKNTITGMSFDVQQKEDLSLLSMNSAGQSNYSNPQSELIGKLKKAIKAADWNEVQILGQSLETGDIDGIAAIRDFKTLKKDAPTGEPAQDEDKYVQIAMSGSPQQWENQDHESMSMRMISTEEESAVTGPPESDLDDKSYLDGVVDDDEEGMETVLPDQQALAKPTRPCESGANQAQTKTSSSNETSQECTCNCVIS